MQSSTSQQEVPSTDQQLQALQDEIVRQDLQLKILRRQIDYELKQLYNNKTLREENREEYVRQRNELNRKKTELGRERAAFYQRKQQLEETLQYESVDSHDLKLLTAAIINEKRQLILAIPPKSSQRATKTSSLPQLVSSEVESGKTDKALLDEAALAQQLAALGETLDTGDDVLLGYVSSVGLSHGSRITESWFDQFGKAQIDLQADEEFSLAFYEFDYLMPYYSSERLTSFMQLGFRNSTGREIYNLGFGSRYFSYGWVLGANVFVDSDQSLGHQRGSLGLEVMTSYVKGYSNVYVPLSGWKEAGGGLESRPALGSDVGLEVQVGWVPGLSLSVEHFKWFDDHVDMSAIFEQDINPETFDKLASSPEGLTVGVAYRPIPLVGLSVERTAGSDSVRNTAIGLDFSWNFDVALSKQLKPRYAGTLDSVEEMREAFVERESNIVLAYREPGSEDGESGLTVTLARRHRVVEKRSVAVVPEVSHSLAIDGINWSGSGRYFLDNPESLTPNFVAGYWDPLARNNRHDLTLTVTDSLGRTGSAKTEVVVEEDPRLQPIVTFTDSDQNPQSSLSLNYGDPPFRVYSDVQSQRLSPALGREGAVDSGQYTYAWEGDVELLNKSDVPNPLVYSSKPVSDYKLTLTVQLGERGETGQGSLPVTINKGVGNKLRIKDASIAMKKDDEFDANENLILGNKGKLSFRTDDKRIATVSDNGVVTAVASGPATITVTEEESDCCLEQSVDFIADVAVGLAQPFIETCRYRLDPNDMFEKIEAVYSIGSSPYDGYDPDRISQVRLDVFSFGTYPLPLKKPMTPGEREIGQFDSQDLTHIRLNLTKTVEMAVVMQYSKPQTESSSSTVLCHSMPQ